MKSAGQMLLKIFSVLFALSLLAFYVAHREGKGPFAEKSDSAESNSGFPVTPTSPTMFSTSKSGPIVVPPPYYGNRPPYDGNRPIMANEIDALIDAAASPAPKDSEALEATPVVLLPGSKSINMPIFTIRKPTDPSERKFYGQGDSFQGEKQVDGGDPAAVSVSGGRIILGGSSKNSVPVISPEDVSSKTKPSSE